MLIDGAIGNDLHRAAASAQMGRLISDEILDAFAVSGRPEEIPGLIQRRFGDLVDRISLYMPYRETGFAPRIMAGLRED